MNGNRRRPPKTSCPPLHRFGQNFLIDGKVLSDTVERADVRPDDVILEIGPGHGVLTRALLEMRPAKIHAVELDERLKPELSELAKAHETISLHWGDAMKTDYASFSPFPNKAVANIPYNITTPLIWKLLEFAPLGLTYHLYMVQKEAADRLTAPPDTKERYPLGVTIEAMGRAALVRRVPPSCFRPAPKVDSALIEIVIEKNHGLTRDPAWSSLLHHGFAHRRKTLLNNLKGSYSGDFDLPSVFNDIGIGAGSRAEDLTVDEWLRLYEAVGKRGFGDDLERAVTDNPDLSSGFVYDILISKAQGSTFAEPFMPGTEGNGLKEYASVQDMADDLGL